MKFKREASDNLTPPEPNGALRSQFELISSYLDGEVTAAERRQVQQWLESDPKAQKLYARLIKLRQTMRSLPVPPALTPIEETIEQVFLRLNRSRWRKLSLAGGAAIAATILAGLSVFSPNRSYIPELATNSPTQSTEAAPEALMVALNKPPIEIPKPAVTIQESEAKERELEFKDLK